MPEDSVSTQICEVRRRLELRLEAIEIAVRKAHEILGLASDSPDSVRRRRNSVQHWNEVYFAAYDVFNRHSREHGCGPEVQPPLSATIRPLY